MKYRHDDKSHFLPKLPMAMVIHVSYARDVQIRAIR